MRKLACHALAAVMLSVPAAAAAEGRVVKGTARAADGVAIAYEARGKGDVALVFVHGWSCNRGHWKKQVDEFARDYRVVAIDLGGHGESGKDREKWRIPDLAGDVEAVVNALTLKKVVLVGHSMGGPVSLLAAKRMPGKVVAVVGVDTLHNAEFKFPEEASKSILKKFEDDFPGTMRGFMGAMFPKKTDPDLVKWVLDGALKADPKVAVPLMKDFSNLDMKAAFREAKVPVRCINAAAKPAGFPTAVETNKKYADYDAVIMEGVGHWPMLERPEEFNKHLRDVLKEVVLKKRSRPAERT